MSTKKQQAQSTKNNAALTKATNIDLTKSLGALANSGVQIQGTLSKISEELITKFAELEAVDSSIALKKQELEALHGADQLLLSIDELKVKHADTIEDLAKQRLAIEEENAEFQRSKAEEARRDQENFNYNLVKLRQAEADKYAEEIRTRNNTERDRQEFFEKDIKTRNETLLLKESAYNEAINKAATFESDLQKAVDKQVAIATNTLKKDFEHQKQLADMQATSNLDKMKHDNVRLVEAANNLETRVTELNAQLKAAYDKNSELASKAVEAANNKAAQADALALVTGIGSTNGRAARS